MGSTGLTAAEYERLLATIERVRAKTQTSEKARELLREEGILTADDRLAEPYAVKEPAHR